MRFLEGKTKNSWEQKKELRTQMKPSVKGHHELSETASAKWQRQMRDCVGLKKERREWSRSSNTVVFQKYPQWNADTDTKNQELRQKLQVIRDWRFFSTEPKAVTVTH